MAETDKSSDSDSIGLDFSFSSSSYDPFSDNEDEEIDLAASASGGTCIQPYQFEPEASDEDDDSQPQATVASSDDEGRLHTTEWCECGNCSILPTARECVCCREIPQVSNKMESYNSGNLRCIVDHPGFRTVCLDEFVLETAYYQYCQEYRKEPNNTNEEKRYIGYRQLVRWCWGFLGRRVRVPLPSCAVSKIRDTFPIDVDTDYTGFKDCENQF